MHIIETIKILTMHVEHYRYPFNTHRHMIIFKGYIFSYLEMFVNFYGAGLKLQIYI